MNINLKRALKLRRTLEAQIKAFTLPSTINIAVLSDGANDPGAQIQANREAVAALYAQAMTLADILSTLRTGILRANVESGVEASLADIARIDRHIAIEKMIAETTAFTPDLGTITQEIEIARAAIKNPEARAYGRATREVSVALTTVEMRDEARRRLADLRRQREDLDDARTAANARVRIEIRDDHAALLTEMGLI